MDTEDCFTGKAINLDWKHPRVPFPGLLLVHEVKARAMNSLTAAVAPYGLDPPYQSWLYKKGIRSSGNDELLPRPSPGSLQRHAPSATGHSTLLDGGRAAGGPSGPQDEAGAAGEAYSACAADNACAAARPAAAGDATPNLSCGVRPLPQPALVKRFARSVRLLLYEGVEHRLPLPN